MDAKFAQFVVYLIGLTFGLVLLIGSLALGWGSSWIVPTFGAALILASIAGFVMTRVRGRGR